VPFRVSLEHPLLSAFAAGAMLRASAATAGIAKVFAMLLRFMMNLLFLIDRVAGPNPAHLRRIRNRGSGARHKNGWSDQIPFLCRFSEC
jgi:hypothetical protein